MTDFLLFDNYNRLNDDAMRTERVELFARTLNDIFKQFKSLWEDYREVLDKSKESKRNSPNFSNGQKHPDESGYATVTNSNRDNVSKKKWIVAQEKETPNYNPVSSSTRENKKPSVQDSEESFQIFSRDFNTQSLEETFINQSMTPALREIQNLTPKRPISPIMSSKKTKPRLSSPTTINSPNGSQKSVVILNDFTNRMTSNSKDPCAANAPADATILASVTKASSSILHSSTSTFKEDVTCPPKCVQKWELSTMYNTDINLVPGSKKKLKQSKFIVRKEKFTDLSNCDDVASNTLDNRQAVGTPDNVRSRNCFKTNDSYLEESLIQVSPIHDKGASKMRQKISRKNKSFDALQQKSNMVERNFEKNIKVKLMSHNENGNTKIADTDITLFEPKFASTQNIYLADCFNRSANNTSVLKSKPSSSKFISATTNDFDTNDDTLFIEKQTPVEYLTPEKTNSEKSERKTKLSLPKKTNSSVNTKEVSGNLLTTKNKESVQSDNELEISLDSSQEMQPTSPPKEQTAARSNFNPFLAKKRPMSPTYVYKASPVRKQAERALLNGWDCYECEKYYKASGLTGDELQKRKNQCSRHRSKFNEKKLSQKGYWNPDFSSSFHSTIWGDE